MAPEPPPGLRQRIARAYRNEGIRGVSQRTGRFLLRPARLAIRVLRVPLKIAGSLRRDGVVATAAKVHRGVYDRTRERRFWKWLPESWTPSHAYTMAQWLAAAERSAPGHKLALHTDFPRAELVQAYMAADLFVFASNIEYSPLVLYEAAAAGTPFLTVPVGNAEEIARWTGAGVVCPAPRDERGYTRVDPGVLADAIAGLAADPQRLRDLGQAGRRRWRENFTWAGIAHRYEAILAGTTAPCKTMLLKETP
jgi:glycosyltransferase involved in cell wall biosynthesis